MFIPIELIIFAAFLLVAYGAHFIGAAWAQHKAHAERVKWLSLAIASAPAAIHGAKEYVVHLIVYSGMIIPPH